MQPPVPASHAILQLFMKAPVPGAVKTRLHPPLSHAQAARVHEWLCVRLCEALSDLPGVTTEIWAGGDDTHPFFIGVCQQFGLPLYRQSEGDLGQRMQASLTDGLRRSMRVVIVGGDCLSVDASYVRQALAWLEAPDRAVLGPAEDGGYVLVGVCDVREGLFANVAWGSECALQQTRNNFRAVGYDVALLAPRWDIDTFADLEQHAPELLAGVIR